MTKNFKQLGIYGCIIVLLTVASYSSAIQGGFIWDDDAYVEKNLTLRSGEGFVRIWSEFGATPQFYPLVFSTFWVEYQLWGLNPFGYHLVNVLIHCLNALLFLIVLQRLKIGWSFFAALLFAIHPVHVESVAWVTELKNVLSGMFYLLALVMYLRFNEVGSDQMVPADGKGRNMNFYGLSLFLYLCALLSKTVTCSLPVALLLITWWKTKGLKKRDLTPLIPFFIVGGIMALTTVWMEKTHVGAEGVDWNLSGPERLIVAGKALWFYAEKLLWPNSLVFSYPKWEISPGIWWQWLFPFSHILVLGLLWFFKDKIGRGPLVATLFFLITLFPALGFIDVYPMRYSYAADHFQYLASLGLIVLIPGVVLKRISAPRNLSMGIATVVILTFSFLTWKQGHVYKNREVLWRDIIAKNEASWMAHNNLGIELVSQNRIEEAITHYKKSLLGNPSNPNAHNNIGVALDDIGRGSEAIKHYVKALELNPKLTDAYVNLGMALSGKGMKENAIDQFRQALALNSNSEEAHSSLGTELALLGRNEEALSHYKEAIRIKPERMDAYINITNVLFAERKFEEAIPYLQKVVAMYPDYTDTYSRLGRAFMGLGKLDVAEKYFRRVLSKEKDNADAYNKLGIIRGKEGRLQEAIDFFLKALGLNPNFENASQNLQFARKQLGK